MVEPFVRARFPMYIKRPLSRFPLSFGVYTLMLNPFMIIFYYILHTRRYLTDVVLRQSLTHRVTSYKKSLNAVNDALTYWRMGYLAWEVSISAGNNAIELTHDVPGKSRFGHNKPQHHTLFPVPTTTCFTWGLGRNPVQGVKWLLYALLRRPSDAF